MPTRKTESVRDVAVAVNAVSFGCSCEHESLVDAEGVTLRGAEASSGSRLVGKIGAKREPG